jgi:hypothetical protein
LEARKAVRRECQRQHYAEVLYEVTRMDAVGALLAAVRSQAQMEIELPHNTLYTTVPVLQAPKGATRLPGTTGKPSGPIQIPLYEDRRFPADPWAR